MLIDYHMHLEGDDSDQGRYTVARVAEYVEAARGTKVGEIGVSEHCHRFAAFRPLLEPLVSDPRSHPEVAGWLGRFFHEDLAAYCTLLQEAQEAGLPVRISLEVDYVPGREEQVRRALADRPWDYVLGSVHYLGLWGIDVSPEVGWPGADVDEAYREYFRTLQRAAASGLFDVLAHPDLVKKFGHRPRSPLGPLLDETADAIAAAGVAVEINTAGLRVPVGEPYPGEELLLRLARRGVPLTLGSDAHRPADVGRDLDRAAALAARCGYRELVSFARREPRRVPLG